MITTSNRTAEYKGRKYRLLYSGPTKYGKRAHLQFFDGTKDFWVDAGLVHEVGESSRSNRSGCPECGRNKPLIHDLEDGGMKCRDCCDIPECGY